MGLVTIFFNEGVENRSKLILEATRAFAEANPTAKCWRLNKGLFFLTCLVYKFPHSICSWIKDGTSGIINLVQSGNYFIIVLVLTTNTRKLATFHPPKIAAGKLISEKTFQFSRLTPKRTNYLEAAENEMCHWKHFRWNLVNYGEGRIDSIRKLELIC